MPSNTISAAVLARARAQIDDVVRRPHHVRIVLHHQDRVAQIAQLFEDADQPAGVAAVQPDRRLVEHVAAPHQPRAQAGRQLDALRFAARKRGRQPVERQVLQPDVVQELQPLPDLDQDLVGDRRSLPGSAPALSKNCCASAMFMRTTSAMFFPPTRTYSASFRSRAPLHSGHSA